MEANDLQVKTDDMPTVIKLAEKIHRFVEFQSNLTFLLWDGLECDPLCRFRSTTRFRWRGVTRRPPGTNRRLPLTMELLMEEATIEQAVSHTVHSMCACFCCFWWSCRCWDEKVACNLLMQWSCMKKSWITLNCGFMIRLQVLIDASRRRWEQVDWLTQYYWWIPSDHCTLIAVCRAICCECVPESYGATWRKTLKM